MIPGPTCHLFVLNYHRTSMLHVTNAPSWTQTAVPDVHKFSAVKHPSGRLSDQSNNNFYLSHLQLAGDDRMNPLNFVQTFCITKLESLIIIRSAILVQHQLVTDGWTDTAYTTLAKCCVGNKAVEKLFRKHNYINKTIVCISYFAHSVQSHRPRSPVTLYTFLA